MSKENGKVAKVPGFFQQRKGSPFLQYRVEIRSHTIRLSSGAKTKEDAEKKKLALYQDALKEAEARDETKNLRATVTTLGEAVAVYWARVGREHNGNNGVEEIDKMSAGARNTFTSLAWLVEHFGRDRKLIEIDTNLIEGAKAKRRGEFKKRGNQITDERVSHATVNRSMTEVLRKVLRYAHEVCEAPIAKIEWGKHKLGEPGERIREMLENEEEAIFAPGVVHPDLADLIDASAISGLRKSEAIFLLEWPDCEWGLKRLRIRNGKGQNGGDQYVPITSALHEILWRQWSKNNRHERFVFSREDKPSGPAPKPGSRRARLAAEREARALEAGEDTMPARHPWTRSALNSAWRRACAKAGVVDLHWHDLRHTFCTRMLRFDPKANLKTVQRAARHKNLDTTLKYAHVRDQDVAEAMEAGALSSSRRRGGGTGSDPVTATHPVTPPVTVTPMIGKN
jgi:integrase